MWEESYNVQSTIHFTSIFIFGDWTVDKSHTAHRFIFKANFDPTASQHNEDNFLAAPSKT